MFFLPAVYPALPYILNYITVKIDFRFLLFYGYYRCRRLKWGGGAISDEFIRGRGLKIRKKTERYWKFYEVMILLPISKKKSYIYKCRLWKCRCIAFSEEKLSVIFIWANLGYFSAFCKIPGIVLVLLESQYLEWTAKNPSHF